MFSGCRGRVHWGLKGINLDQDKVLHSYGPIHLSRQMKKYDYTIINDLLRNCPQVWHFCWLKVIR